MPKILVHLCTIVAMNVLFAQVYLGYQPVTLDYFFANAVFVATPLLLLFFVVGMRQRETEDRLLYLSRTDDLTGMFNRRTFMTETRARLKKDGAGVLLMLDADHFKRINDTYGHAAGDICLEAIARRVEIDLGPSDVAGRLGGEEFAVYLPGKNLASARDLAARLTEPISFQQVDDNPHLRVTLSIGGAAVGAEKSLDLAMQQADEAMYAAKSAGRARAIFWEDLEGVQDQTSDRSQAQLLAG